jgi:prepilin-type N-terminal cleavage/methylation domain-containing protein
MSSPVSKHLQRGQAGFTLVEVMVASALLGASLIVMFGFHAQAVRSNMNARRLTDCTYLAQTQMERLQSMDWTSASQPTALQDAGMDDGSYSMWNDMEQWGGVEVNGANTEDTTLGPVMYTVSWDIQSMDTDETWLRLRVRCTWSDDESEFYPGTTISSYRFRDS